MATPRITCADGRVPTPDGAHCCWPGQAWNSEWNECSGEPSSCPQGFYGSCADCVRLEPPSAMIHVPGGNVRYLYQLGPGAKFALVPVKAFDIDVTEVTIGQLFKYYADRNGGRSRSCQRIVQRECNWSHSNRDNHPVNCADEYLAEEYCKSVGKRLPTAQEWLRAAHAGNPAKWWADRHGGWNCPPVGSPTDLDPPDCPVDGYPQDVTPLGIRAMGGSVEEWTSTRRRECPRCTGQVRENSRRLYCGSTTGWRNEPSCNESLMPLSLIGLRCAR